VTTYDYITAGSFTWTCPGAGVATFEVWGGGGGGGAGDGNGTTTGNGGGGGAGGYAKIELSVRTGNYPLIVGAAGTAGGSGGTSDINLDIYGTATAIYASGGLPGADASAGGVGGAGGSGSGGQIAVTGGTGDTGTLTVQGVGGRSPISSYGTGGAGGLYSGGAGSSGTVGRVLITYSPVSTPFLTHSPAQIIQQMMIDLGVGTDGSLNNAWPIFSTEEPDDPDNCITVYDTTGSDDGRSMVDGKSMQHHGIQVRIRSYDHQTGYVKAREIRSAFEGVLNKQTSIETNLYLVECINKIGDVLCLGQDVPASKRRVFTLNVVTPITKLI